MTAALVVAVVSLFAAAASDRPSSTVACYERADHILLFLEHPRTCDIEMGDQAFGWFAELRALRWSGWGESVATARGKVDGQPTRVRVWRPRTMCGDIDHSRIYTRMRFTSSYGESTIRRPACDTQPRIEIP